MTLTWLGSSVAWLSNWPLSVSNDLTLQHRSPHFIGSWWRFLILSGPSRPTSHTRNLGIFPFFLAVLLTIHMVWSGLARPLTLIRQWWPRRQLTEAWAHVEDHPYTCPSMLNCQEPYRRGKNEIEKKKFSLTKKTKQLFRWFHDSVFSVRSFNWVLPQSDFCRRVLNFWCSLFLPETGESPTYSSGKNWSRRRRGAHITCFTARTLDLDGIGSEHSASGSEKKKWSLAPRVSEWSDGEQV